MRRVGYSWLHTAVRLDKDPVFLSSGVKCAGYFLRRLKPGEGKRHHPDVALRDAGTSLLELDQPPRDSSATMIAAFGMLNVPSCL